MITFKFNENAPTKQFEEAVATEMDKTVKFFEKELLKIRTGRAHPSLLEDIKVLAYGNMTPLKQLAAVSAPEPSLLVVQPWDKSIMSDVEKALSTSDLGVTPLNDGNVIRIQLPRMSTQRREELVKGLHKKLEESKVALRTTRKDFHTLIRDAEKSKKISEDYSKRIQDSLQKTTDKMIEIAEGLSRKKEDEIKTV